MKVSNQSPAERICRLVAWLLGIAVFMGLYAYSWTWVV